MAVYYVGPGGNNANPGTSWTQRKLTLNGAEDIPLVAGDTVYVGPGTYRETLTLDVSGSLGNPITYIGDYLGTNTDKVGGVVRITGSDNDQTATRANGITGTSRNYRTFQGFTIDLCTTNGILNTSGTNWIIQKCHFNIVVLQIAGASQANCTIQDCALIGNQFLITHGSNLDNVGHVIQNCYFANSQTFGIRADRVGGITVKNNVFHSVANGVRVVASPNAGQTITVNNCILVSCLTALQAATLGDITEDYNTLFGNGTARTNVAVGANSLAYPPLFDTRWFFQVVHESAGPNSSTQLVTPFDLSSYSPLLNVAGTSPTTTDMRGTAVVGSQREWGALEYDSTLSIKARQSALIAGGMVQS